MDGRSPYRADLIPSGHCVDGEESIVETFADIDTNNSDMRKLALATAACRSCIQFGHCQDQVEGLATELWQRGVGLVVVGGDARAAPTLERRSPTEDRPAFAFDLAKIPEDPSLALSMLRQGSRTGQFDVKGHTPSGVKDTAELYMRQLEAEDPSLYAKLQEMDEEELDKGFKYILTTLFQQKDYALYSRGKGSGQQAKQRYNPDRFDVDQDSGIVSLYFRDVIAISGLGLKRASTKAMRFEPTFYKQLVESAGKNGMRLSTIDEIISGSSKAPLAALTKREARKEAFYDANPGLPKSAASRLARSSAPAGVVESVDALFKTYKDVPRHIVKAVCEQRPANVRKSLDGVEQRIRAGQNKFGTSDPIVRRTEMASIALRYTSTQEYLDALQSFYDNMVALSDRYADNRDILESDLRSFSNFPLEKGIEAAETFLDNLTHLRQATRGAIPESILHEEARKGTASVATIRHNYHRRLISNRVRVRAKNHNEIPPSPGIIDRIATLYPTFEQGTVTDTVYDLINNEQLVMTRADAFARASNTTESLTRIITPEPRQYVTFRSELTELTPYERLSYAHYHNLMPLLYGRTGNPLLVEAFALANTTIQEHYENTLEARIQNLCSGQPESAFSFMQLEEDLHVFDAMLASNTSQPLPQEGERLIIKGLRDTQVVIGGKALYLKESGFSWDWADNTPDFTDWLHQKITDTYPPHQQERAIAYAQDACANGVLELLGNSPSEYRLVFSKGFYGKAMTELERASIANAMGIDRLVYGSDLTLALKHRLGKKT